MHPIGDNHPAVSTMWSAGRRWAAGLCVVGAGAWLVVARQGACLHGARPVEPWAIVGATARSSRTLLADAPVRCGQVVRGTTVGAPTDRYSTRDYEAWLCFPGVDDRDRAGERSYALDLGRHRAARVHLRPLYVDLELAALSATVPGQPLAAPTAARLGHNCEVTMGTIEDVQLDASVSTRWLLVVEGTDGKDGDFELEIACED